MPHGILPVFPTMSGNIGGQRNVVIIDGTNNKEQVEWINAKDREGRQMHMNNIALFANT